MKALQPTDFQVFTTIERKYINEELEHSFLKVWIYQHAKQSEKPVERTLEEEVGIEELIHHLGLDFFYRCNQATNMPTHCDDNSRAVE